MKNTIFSTLIIIFFGISFLQGCGEDEPVNVQQDPVHTEKEYGAFVLCAGNDQYPPERYLGYYDIKSDSFKLNILLQGQLPQTPSTMEYSNGILYFPISTNVYPVNPRIIYLGAWGELKGNVLMEKFPETKVGALLPFNNYIAVTYQPVVSSHLGTLEIRNRNTFDWQYRYSDIKSYISAIRFLNNKLYLLLSDINNIHVDSSLAVVEPFSENVTKIPLRSLPKGLIVTNEGKLIAACSGSSNMLFHIDPVTMSKTDSVVLNNGFSNRLRYSYGSSLIYFISKDDKIIKYIPSTKTSIIFINNDLSAEGYTITGYNIDQYSGKHYVLYSNVNSYKPGKLRIYSSYGYFEKMFNTPKIPVDVIIEKEP